MYRFINWMLSLSLYMYALCAARYMKAVGILKTSEFKSNAQNARALEVMIPCHNNAATCYIKLKNYGDARLLSENVGPVAMIALGPYWVGDWLGLA